MVFAVVTFTLGVAVGTPMVVFIAAVVLMDVTFSGMGVTVEMFTIDGVVSAFSWNAEAV